MKVKIKKSILKQAIQSVMQQGSLRQDNQQLVKRIDGLVPRTNDGGVQEQRFVHLLNMIVGSSTGRNILENYLEIIDSQGI